MKSFKQFLLETRDSQREIRAIADEFFDSFVDHIESYPKEQVILPKPEDAFDHMFLDMKRIGDYIRIGRYSVLKDFLRDASRHMQVIITSIESGRFLPSGSAGTFVFPKSQYKQMKDTVLVVGVPIKAIQFVIQIFKTQEDPNKAFGKIKDRWKVATEKISRGTFIHELTHAYDYYVSEGRFTDAEGIVKSGDDEAGYYASQHEVNARYSDTIAQLDGVKGDLDKYDYIKRFMEMFVGWDVLDYSQQKRLIKRATMEWYER